jgi:hypothetical protein
MVPFAIEQPDGSISIINIGSYVVKYKAGGKNAPQPT